MHSHGSPKCSRVPLLTRHQVELMQIDTVSSPEMPGFVELGISEAILQKMLKGKRPIGDSNQRASSMLLRLPAIAVSVPPRETQVEVKHRGTKLLRPSAIGLCEGRLALAHCDCQSRK